MIRGPTSQPPSASTFNIARMHGMAQGYTKTIADNQPPTPILKNLSEFIVTILFQPPGESPDDEAQSSMTMLALPRCYMELPYGKDPPRLGS